MDSKEPMKIHFRSLCFVINSIIDRKQLLQEIYIFRRGKQAYSFIYLLKINIANMYK